MRVCVCVCVPPPRVQGSPLKTPSCAALTACCGLDTAHKAVVFSASCRLGFAVLMG
jgi:hypothetical protein